MALLCFDFHYVSLVCSTANIGGMKRIIQFMVPALFMLPMYSQAEVSLDLIELPDGFQIDVYADGVENARQMVLGDKGTLFVGSR